MVFANGTIELIKPLNYEIEPDFQLSVQIDGKFKGN